MIEIMMMIMMVIITLLVGNPCHPESVARRQRTTIRNPGAHALLLLCLKTLFKFLIRNLRESVSGRFRQLFCLLARAPSFKFQKREWEAHLVPNSLLANCFVMEMQDPQITRDMIQALYKKNRENEIQIQIDQKNVNSYYQGNDSCSIFIPSSIQPLQRYE